MPRTAKRERKPRSREEAASYAVGHRIRIEILAVLHEGPATIKELSSELRRTRGTITHHVEEMLVDGSIEIARTAEVGSVTEYWYCMAELPEYTSEEIAELSDEEKQGFFSLILQSTAAEAFAALWAGRLLDDPQLTLAWNRIDLDEQARLDLASEQDRSWERMHEIAAEAAHRRCESKEPAVTYVIAQWGSRDTGPRLPLLGRRKNPDVRVLTLDLLVCTKESSGVRIG